MSIAGIYKILHKPSTQCYIGESEDIGKRIFDHAFALFTNTHKNPTLQLLWNDNPYIMDWIVEILAITSDNTSLRKEIELSFIEATPSCISHTGERQHEPKPKTKEYLKGINLFYSKYFAKKSSGDKTYLTPLLTEIEKGLADYLQGEYKDGYIYSKKRKLYAINKFFTDTNLLTEDDKDVLDKVRKDIIAFKENNLP